MTVNIGSMLKGLREAGCVGLQPFASVRVTGLTPDPSVLSRHRVCDARLGETEVGMETDHAQTMILCLTFLRIKSRVVNVTVMTAARFYAAAAAG